MSSKVHSRFLSFDADSESRVRRRLAHERRRSVSARILHDGMMIPDLSSDKVSSNSPLLTFSGYVEEKPMAKDPLVFQSRRSPVLGTRGMVATSQPLAAQIGLQILARGGNAADAAVATAAALSVVEPTSTGIGGDCFALFYQAASRSITALNGSGRAPRGLSLDLLRARGFVEALPPFHALTVTVPGACAGWCDLVARHGHLPMAEVLSPSIDLAEQGFPVSPITAYHWQRGVENQLGSAPGGLEMTIDGRAPRTGELFRNPGLARTLRAVAEGGGGAFYEGDIARAIAQAVQDAGGMMTVDDLAAHRSTWEEPLSTTYRSYEVWECPPNGQGLVALLALNILEGYELSAIPALDARRIHLMVEALRLAFADARWYIGDPSFCAAPYLELLSKTYAAQRRRLMDTKRVVSHYPVGRPEGSSDTIYLTAVDGEGNACSFINSNYMGFGTGIVPKGCGFTLHNRGLAFSLDPAHPNALAAGKRPYHTIIPALVTRPDGSLYASFGVMGGFMQPQGHVQVLVGLIDDGLDPQEALDRPRFCLEEGSPQGRLAVEEGIPKGTLTRLSRMGHEIVPLSGYDRAIFGRGQAIVRDWESGVLWGGSDPRADGCAVALP